jgi:hypothetical protein
MRFDCHTGYVGKPTVTSSMTIIGRFWRAMSSSAATSALAMVSFVKYWFSN